jgi:hypothetical protein
MNFGIDYNKLVNWLTLKSLRKAKHIAWLQTLIAPVKSKHTQLLTFITATNFEMSITGQVIKLRYALNEKYDMALRRFIIRDTPPQVQLYTFLEVENRPVYMPFFMNGGGSDFEVVVPFDLQTQDIYIRSLLNKYKLPGKRYKIIYV